MNRVTPSMELCVIYDLRLLGSDDVQVAVFVAHAWAALAVAAVGGALDPTEIPIELWNQQESD